MNFSQLRTFLAVARHLSFSRAADELDTSQPRVSMHVQALEAAVDTPLFERVGRRVHLTEAGQVLAEYASSILGLVADAEQALAELRGVLRGRLTIAASTTPGAYLLPPLLARFRTLHPHVELSLNVGNVHDVERALLERRADLGVMASAERAHRLAAEPYVQDELVLIVGSRHRLTRDTSLRVAGLTNEAFIFRDRDSATRTLIDAEFARVGFQPRVIMELNTTEAIKEAVAAHLAVSIVSRYAIQSEAAAGRLRPLSLIDLELTRSLSLVYPHGKRLSAAAAAFRRLLLEARGTSRRSDHNQ